MSIRENKNSRIKIKCNVLIMAGIAGLIHFSLIDYVNVVVVASAVAVAIVRCQFISILFIAYNAGVLYIDLQFVYRALLYFIRVIN